MKIHNIAIAIALLLASEISKTDTAQASDDVLSGGDDDDLFVIEDWGGSNTITDFTAGAGTEDKIDVSAFAFLAFDDGTDNDVERSAMQVGTDVLIQLDANDSVTLLGVQVEILHADDFLF